MLLRSVTKHLKEQNWFAVFIDFLIVVIGILIAFQITEWNEKLQQQKTASNYIERLHEELQANIKDLKQRKSYFEQTKLHALDAHDALNKAPELLGIQFLIDIYQTSQIIPRDIGRDTYDEILSVGANDAVTNVNARKRLANYYRSIKALDITLFTVTSYRELIREGMPYAAQAAIRKSCDDIESTDPTGTAIISLPESCEPSMTKDEIAHGISTILKLDIRKPLVRRLSDLDLKITHVNLFIERTKVMDDFLVTLIK